MAVYARPHLPLCFGCGQGVAKYGLKTVLTLVQVNQQDHGNEGANPSTGGLLESAWEMAYSRVVDGIDTFGQKQQTIKLLALQVGARTFTVIRVHCWMLANAQYPRFG